MIEMKQSRSDYPHCWRNVFFQPSRSCFDLSVSWDVALKSSCEVKCAEKLQAEQEAGRRVDGLVHMNVLLQIYILRVRKS